MRGSSSDTVVRQDGYFLSFKLKCKGLITTYPGVSSAKLPFKMRLLRIPATVPRLFPFVPGTLMTALRAVLGSVGLGIPPVFL